MTFNYRKPYESTTTDRETTEAHESFGLISIHRVQSTGTRLFGSSLESHGHYFTLQISQCERSHGLSHDRYFGGPRKQLIEVMLSAAQFAELITSLNMSSGVPCTIYRVLGDTMEPLPRNLETESKKIRSSFKDDVKGLVEKLAQGAKRVDELLEKKSLTIADKSEIREVLVRVRRDVKENLPFIVASFQESTERTLTQAKTEMDAFVQMGLHRLGLESLEAKLASGKSVSFLPSQAPVVVEDEP